MSDKVEHPDRPSVDRTAQLLVVRSLLDRARDSMSDASEVGGRAAMLLLDVAVETLTKVACRHRDVQPPKDRQDSLHAWLDALVTSCKTLKGTPEIGAARGLRGARNSVQHDGLPLALPGIRTFRDHAEAFATRVVREVFDLDFAAVSVVDLVRDRQARCVLNRAIAERAAGHWLQALLWICLAYDNLCHRWEDASRRAILQGRLTLAPMFWNLSTVQRYMRPLVPADILLSKVPTINPEYRMLILMMGFAPDDLERLSMLVDTVAERVNPLSPGAPFEMPVESSDVHFALETVARQAWRLESVYPGIFGETAYERYQAFTRTPPGHVVAEPGAASAAEIPANSRE